MIPIQINGRTIFLRLEEWLEMSDEDYQNLIANNEGYEIDNPFDKLIDKIDSKEWNVPPEHKNDGDSGDKA